MWVYDGEEWYQEGSEQGSGRPTTPNADTRPTERFYPELQIVQVPRVQERFPDPPPLMIIP